MLATEMQQLGQSRAQLLQQSNENRMVLEVRQTAQPHQPTVPLQQTPVTQLTLRSPAGAEPAR
jgi:hypothetical protein